MKKPILSGKRKNFTAVGVVLGYDWPEYLAYVFKTIFLKPKINIDFSLETGATEFSLSYFLLSIKSDYKEIGNIDVNLTGNFFDINKQEKITFPFTFQELPQIIEAGETAIFKFQPEIDFSNLQQSSNIKLTVDYGYMFLGQVHSVSYYSVWGFDMKNEIKPTISLLTSKETKS